MVSLPFIDFHLRTRIVFGFGTLSRLTSLAGELGFTRTLVVADAGITAAGYVDTVAALLRHTGSAPSFFHGFDANPDSDMVEAGRKVAAAAAVDSIVAIGGGSSLDCAKGINFVLTNGGMMKDYWGHGKAASPMLPSIGIPTTAGTGSEAQQYAIISDPHTHVKMACGDEKASFRVAILDPALTISQPQQLTAVTGYDAISHAVESFVTSKRTAMSDLFAREAWRLLESHYERVLANPEDRDARSAMLLGSHEAGIAIEQSMLGATHACANPLTAQYGTTHGVAIALMLPHVVRWNAEVVGERYADLLRASGRSDENPGESLARRLEELARAGGLPARLRDAGVRREDLESLSVAAGKQWTGTFNPRAFDAGAALALYDQAF
jgi:alcohol dehydrogenase